MCHIQKNMDKYQEDLTPNFLSSRKPHKLANGKIDKFKVKDILLQNAFQEGNLDLGSESVAFGLLSSFRSSETPIYQWCTSRETLEKCYWFEIREQEGVEEREEKKGGINEQGEDKSLRFSGNTSRKPYTADCEHLLGVLQGNLEVVPPTPEMYFFKPSPKLLPEHIESNSIKLERLTGEEEPLFCVTEGTFLDQNWRSDKECNQSPLRKKRASYAYCCPKCTKEFKRPSGLRTHMVIHYGRNPFFCKWPNCSKKFNVKSNLLRHYRSHNRE